MSTLIKTICHHARPTTLAALIADIGQEEGEMLIKEERLQL